MNRKLAKGCNQERRPNTKERKSVERRGRDRLEKTVGKGHDSRGHMSDRTKRKKGMVREGLYHRSFIRDDTVRRFP